MIRNGDELEMALGQVTAWLDAPPRPGTPEDRRFRKLLKAIEDYCPQLQKPAPTPKENAERAKLRGEVEAFVKRIEKHRSSVMGDMDVTLRSVFGRR